MKPNNLKISSLFYVALMSLIITSTFSTSPAAAACVFVVLVAFSKIPMPSGASFMAITVEIWKNDIVENLFKDNEFLKRAVNADQYVLQGKVVHIPVAGTPSTVTKNLGSFPAVAVKRTDTDITYSLDTFYTTPRHIENIENYELSYDKRQSAVGEDEAAVIESAADAMMYNWAPLVGKTVLTQGASQSATITGGTAAVKKFTKASVNDIKKLMDKANVSKQGRVFLLTTEHYNDLLADFTDNEKTNFHNLADMKEGIIGRYLGFDFYSRSTVARYRGADGAYVAVDEQAAGFAASDQTSDRAASLAWQERGVERALGSVDMFTDDGNPLYYGDVFSMTVRSGGRIRRTASVYAVVEAIA